MTDYLIIQDATRSSQLNGRVNKLDFANSSSSSANKRTNAIFSSSGGRNGSSSSSSSSSSISSCEETESVCSETSQTLKCKSVPAVVEEDELAGEGFVEDEPNAVYEESDDNLDDYDKLRAENNKNNTLGEGDEDDEEDDDDLSVSSKTYSTCSSSRPGTNLEAAKLASQQNRRKQQKPIR